MRVPQSLLRSPILIFLSLIVSSHQLISEEKSNGTDKVQNGPPPNLSVCHCPVFGCVVTPVL